MNIKNDLIMTDRQDTKLKTANNLQSETIDWLRFPLVIFVILIHSFGLPVNLTEINYSAISGMDIYNVIRIFIREIAGICNSVFFLFSGYLFFSNINMFNKETYTKKLKSRIKTLLVPYILWNIICVIIRFVSIWGGRIIKKDGDWERFTIFFNELLDKGIWDIFWHYNTWGDRTNILGWSMPGMGPFSVPMWFLQTLIILTIMSPIIYLICKYLKIYGIILLGILYYTGIWFSISGFSIGAIFFFTLGAYYGIYKKNLINKMRQYNICWYVISILTLIPSTYYDYNGISTYNYFRPIFIIAMVISSINIASYLIEKKRVKVNKTLSQATFFVYAIHSILILTIVGIVFDKIFGSNSPIILTVRYFSVPIITAYLCVVIYCIMKKIMPKMLSYLSGGR
jgi:fucose 4-O-acetylase-like acetyltransferase